MNEISNVPKSTSVKNKFLKKQKTKMRLHFIVLGALMIFSSALSDDTEDGIDDRESLYTFCPRFITLLLLLFTFNSF